jgi:hypothetical protein
LGFVMFGAALFWVWFAISPALGRSDTRTSGYAPVELLTEFWADFVLIGGVALLGTLFVALGRRSNAATPASRGADQRRAGASRLVAYVIFAFAGLIVWTAVLGTAESSDLASTVPFLLERVLIIGFLVAVGWIVLTGGRARSGPGQNHSP